jgi:hypothetical protein
VNDDDIDITGIDRAALLVALYHGTCAQGLGVLHDTPTFDLSVAEDVLRKTSAPVVRVQGDKVNFDWVAGRPIKCGFDGNKLVRAYGYDRDAPGGEGSARRIVESLRAKVVTP